jgi:UDP-N-acetylmuramoylalanine--D-glutamate ligase
LLRVTGFAGQNVVVLGLARSGRAAAHALAAGGAHVLGVDDDADTRAAAAAEGIRVASPDAAEMAGCAAVLASPGIPLTHPAPHPLLARARQVGVPILGDIELFRRALPDAPLIGITGTNGKSTTTAMIGHLLAADGRNPLVAGNIGRPILAAEPPAPGAPVVLELSSFQLDLNAALRCKVAVWLNLTPDHLDRHGDLAGYAAAKRRIFAGQGPDDWAVVGVDDAHGRAEVEWLRARRQGPRVVPVGVGHVPAGGIGIVEGVLVDDRDGRRAEIGPIPTVASLRGRHNAQNVAAAYAAVAAFGVPASVVLDALACFDGLPHRMEAVGAVDGIACINDSKATNPEAAATSLVCFEHVYWIAGGKPKPGGFAAVEPHLGRVRHAFLIGEAAPALSAFLGDRVPHRPSGTLERALDDALAAARRDATAAAVVLLAPACASFDQFRDYEARGDAFRALVRARSLEPAA